MKKPISALLARFFMNIAPCIRASGGKVVELSRDFRRLNFHIDDAMLARIREQVERNGEGTFTWPLALRAASGTVYAEIDKVLYVAKKEYYEAKLRRRAT